MVWTHTQFFHLSHFNPNLVLAHGNLSHSYYDFQTLNAETPNKVLSTKFILHNDTTSYRLRNSEWGQLDLPQPRTDYVC